jgi:hypothetical protein
MLPTEPASQNTPAFDEPWQAQVYGMAQVLLENGTVTPMDWGECLGAAIRARLASGDCDTTQTYFAAVADALAGVLAINGDELDQVVEAWRNAYEVTPHGKPVVLGNKP